MSFMTGDQVLAHLVGDFFLQSDWMATNKKSRILPCLIHVLLYTVPFLFLTRSPLALLVIMGTHFAIDHWKFPQRLVWAKNWFRAPAEYRKSEDILGSLLVHGLPSGPAGVVDGVASHHPGQHPPPGHQRGGDKVAVMFKENKRKLILQALVHTIEAKGGLTVNCDGDFAPVADEEWTDLAETYLQACEALHRRPLIQNDLVDEDEED